MGNRRQFIVQSVGAFGGLLSVDSIFARAARAAAQITTPGSAATKSLVVDNLQGGTDGLNTIVPYGDPTYYKVRPTINVSTADILKIDSSIGMNPKLSSMKALFDQQRVAVLQGVHYPNYVLSHFRGTEIWQTAAPDSYETTGWAGRYLDSAKLPSNNLFKGVAIGPVLPKMLIAEQTDVPAIGDLRGFRFNDARDEQAQADKILAGD